MISQPKTHAKPYVTTFNEFVRLANYSLMEKLNADPDAEKNGKNHLPREVFSGHYVPVTPTPLETPKYVTHSAVFFHDLGLSDELVLDEKFAKLFSGDLSIVHAPMHRFGWATGYALSIYGTEYTRQCPFGTGNGYGDGRAISVFEGVINGKRWEMQLKGGGPTPYCRGADGRAVLRSSVREFLAQEYMHALGISSSRSFTLYVSQSETVSRPWYSQSSESIEPDIVEDNFVAISTRVAPSFLRVGQLELFARRARHNHDSRTLEELRMIVAHLIEREYQNDIDQNLAFKDQLIELATLFRRRLISLVTHWLRVGYCQGNFNSDNCAAGGFTLDYGPFGFCELFHPGFQPWIGGGEHFSFFNQPIAAESNYHMLCFALKPLLEKDSLALEKLNQMCQGFSEAMRTQIQKMWASKLGLTGYHPELFENLRDLMIQSQVDYTLFFRELSNIPDDVSLLKKSFYKNTSSHLDEQWQCWLKSWYAQLTKDGHLDDISSRMKLVNPKYTWREWLILPAYQQAVKGDFTLIKELQEVFRFPYDEQSKEIEEKYYRLKPKTLFHTGGISHYSCSS